MLRSANGETGMGVTFKTSGLPRFILWKNTAAENDGYVIGMEPATNYPNVRSYEASQGRVVEIEPGETASFRVTLHPLTESESVEKMSARIKSLQTDEPGEIHSQPRPGWTPGA
jgi:hypothetical protein